MSSVLGMPWQAFLAVVTLSFGGGAYAGGEGEKEIFLRFPADPGPEQAKAYRSELESARPGDWFVFEDGARFQIEGVALDSQGQLRAHLGEGGTTRVFKIKGVPEVVRIPSKLENCCGYNLNTMREGPLLRAGGVRTPEIYVRRSSPLGHYVLAEYVPIQRTLAGDLNAVRLRRLSVADFKSRWREPLQDFARTTGQFSEITDFHVGQLGMTAEGKVHLMDVGRRHEWASGFRDRTAFDSHWFEEWKERSGWLEVPEDMRDEVVGAARDSRKTLAQAPFGIGKSGAEILKLKRTPVGAGVGRDPNPGPCVEPALEGIIARRGGKKP